MADPGARPALASRPRGEDGGWLRRALAEAREGLRAEADQINDLNVFPVPDGDTGSNLLLTLGAACEAVERLPPAADIGAVGRAAAHGALMGARGNSGVILSQILRGFAQGLDGGGVAAPDRLATALVAAATVAHRAVLRPKPGTILTVARDAGAAGQAAGSASGASSGSVLDAAAGEAWAAVARTPSQLPVLEEAGVVDAGGFGLAVVLSAFARAAGGTGARPAPPARARRTRSGPVAVAAPAEGYGYCTEFRLVGGGEDALGVRTRLAEVTDLGDSALVVGDPGLVHVHVHTPEPGRLVAAAERLGRVERLSVTDMTEQHRRAGARARGATPVAAPALRGSAPAAVETGSPIVAGPAVVAVAPGPGFRAILLDCGAAAVVAGGPTQHPSTGDLLEGVRRAGPDEVVLLPNHPDIVPTAQQAARLAGARVEVVPSRSVPEGIAALLALDPARDLRSNRERMERAMAGVRTVEVTTAVRDSRQEGRQIRRGDVLALVDGRIAAAGGDLAQVTVAALEGMGAAELELVTLYRGADASADDARRVGAAVTRRFPGLEVERQDGGQPLYPFVISVE